MDNINANNNICMMHSMSIPSIDPIVRRVIIVNTKVLLLFLKLARIISNICRMHSKDVFGLINNSKNNSKFRQYTTKGVIPLII